MRSRVGIALFGISAPLGKLLLPRVDGWVLAGLFYLGAGTGLTLFRAVQPAIGTGHAPESLRRRDLPLLLTIAIVGGGAGPVLLLVGLGHLSGVLRSLLLNLEAVFTMLLAVLFFGERLSLRETLATAVVLAGAVLLSLGEGGTAAEFVGVVANIGKRHWPQGLDNNLTARLSHRNAVDLVRVKGRFIVGSVTWPSRLRRAKRSRRPLRLRPPSQSASSVMA